MCLGFRGLGFRVPGLEFRVPGLGFRVQGSGCKVRFLNCGPFLAAHYTAAPFKMGSPNKKDHDVGNDPSPFRPANRKFPGFGFRV